MSPALFTTNHRRAAAFAGHLAGVALLVLGASAPGRADAARPFVTDDAGTLAPAECEIEPVAGRSRARGEPHTTALTLQGGCGIGAGSQLGAAVTRERRAGASDMLFGLGGKTALGTAGPGPEPASFALGWSAGFARPAGESRHFAGYGLVLIATQPLGDALQAHVNLGWARDQLARSHALTWAAALERRLDAAFDVGLEAFGDNHGSRSIGGGLRWTLNERVSANLSVAREFGRDTGRPVEFTVGARFVF